MATQPAPVQITATPAVGQSVEHNGKTFNTVKEGSAYILVPPNAQTSVDPARSLPTDGSESQNVFYNPVQQFNRDLSVLAIKAFGEDMCQRKVQKHDQFSAKKVKKLERKRKAKEEQNQHLDLGGVEISRTEQESHIGSDDIAPRAKAADSNTATAIIESTRAAHGQKRQGEDKHGQRGEESKAQAQRTVNGSAEVRDESVVESEAAGSTTAPAAIDLPAGTSSGAKRKRSDDEQSEHRVNSSAKARRVVNGSETDYPVAALELVESGIAAGTTNDNKTCQGQRHASHLQTVLPSGDATTQPSNDQVPQSRANHPATPTQTNATQTDEWKPRFRILDALSASGLRALRYASEISFATEVVANDRDKIAVKSINMNVQHNKLAKAITATHSDALGHMYAAAFPPSNSHGPSHVSGKYDVIDLDPYGTAAPFLDAALQALEDGGLLCVTSTDSGVFASCGYSEKTFALYGGMPIKGLHCHEGGLRLLLHSIATTASRYGIAIEPLLSLSIDFYVRLFIRVRKSPADVKFLAGKTMLVYGCDHGCGAWSTQLLGRHQKHKNSDTNWKFLTAQAPSADQLCQHCGSKTHIAGPMWAGPLHNPAFIEKVLADLKFPDPEIYQTKPRIEGMLDTALDELITFSDTMDLREGPLPSNAKRKNQTRDLVPRTPPEAIDHHPFFFIPSALCKIIKAVAPPEHLVKGALRHAGYKATRSHCRPGSIKTDASWEVIWEIMREWVRQKSPIKEGALKEGTAGHRILQKTREEPGIGDANAAEAAGDGAAVDEDTPDVIQDAPTTPAQVQSPQDVKRLRVIFDEKLGKDKPGKRMVRYQENPKENWGPMRKARGTA
jgi:tRNA (guanine26-N2/guanine27-N2)-dimethyltransferase